MKTTKFLFILLLPLLFIGRQVFKTKNVELIRIRKRFFFLIVFLLFFTKLFSFGKELQAQCIANAGNDTTFCTGSGTSFLGGYPAVTAGVPPFSYTWSCVYGASNFLNDTTVSNPYLISSFYGYADTITFYLTVEDSTGYICSDSVRVSVCEYVFISQIPVYINQGDSVHIYASTSGSCPPFTFQWTPVYNISDPFDPSPIVWPDSTTTYYLIITDAAGCEVIDYCQVIVNPPNVISNNKVNFEFTLFPNPCSEHLNLRFENQTHDKLSIEFFSHTGKVVFSDIVSNVESYSLNTSNFASGLYLLRLTDRQQLQTYKIIVAH